METRTNATKWQVRLCVGLVAGALIAYVDNFAFEGEVSPIVIVAMLFVVTLTAGALWGRSAWITVIAAWVCLPLAHVVKHVLGLPDTLHPNTYTSIFYLAAFTLVIGLVGTGSGIMLRRFATGGRGQGSGPA